MKRILPYFFICLIHSTSFANIDAEIFIGGSFNFNSAMTKQSSVYNKKHLPSRGSITTDKNNLNKTNYLSQDAYFDFLILGKKDTSVIYGARSILAFDSKRDNTVTYNEAGNRSYANGSTKSVFAKQAYMFLERQTLGRFEFGDVDAASKKMKVDAAHQFGGTGGIAGKWWRYVNIPEFGLNIGDDSKTNDVRYAAGKGNMGFIIRPDLPLSHGYSAVTGPSKFDDTRTISRISYYTPRISGIQVGAGFAPDSGDRGASYFGESFSSSVDNSVKDIVDWGINYVEQFDDFGLALSITGEYGYSEDTTAITANNFYQTDLSAHAIGMYVFYGNASISGSYGNWGDGLMFVNNSLNSASTQYRNNEGDYMTLGASYEFSGDFISGPSAFKIGTSYLKSTYRQQGFNLISTAIDYRMSKNFTIYGEYNKYKFDINSADIPSTGSANPFQSFDNKGDVILFGLRLDFGDMKNPSQILSSFSESVY
jgi:hypothetical protein